MAAALNPEHSHCVGALCCATALLFILAAGADAAALSGWFNGSCSYFSGPADQAYQNNPDGKGFQETIDSGSCGYGMMDPRMWPFYNVVGLHPTSPIVRSRPQGACGSCLEVQCVDSRNICYPTFQPTIALVTNECNRDCNATNINIHALAFQHLAPLKYGRMDVRYRLVECNVPGNLTIHVTDYRASEGGWIRLFLENIAGDAGIAGIELAQAPAQGTTVSASVLQALNWQKMSNTFGANWELNGFPAPPLALRATNTLGQQVIVANAILTAGQTGEFPTTVQFPSSTPMADTSSGPSTPAPTAATPTTFRPPFQRPGAASALPTPAIPAVTPTAGPATGPGANRQQYSCTCGPAAGKVGPSNSVLTVGGAQKQCYCTLQAPAAKVTGRRLLLF